MAHVFPEPRVPLRGWIRRFGGEPGAAIADVVPLDEHGQLVRVAATIVDCVVRRILVMPGRYADGIAPLADLPSLADVASLPRALEAMRAWPPHVPSSLRSATLAASYLETLVHAASRDESLEAWSGIFGLPGALYMAVARHERAGLPPDAVSGAIDEGMLTLPRCRSSRPPR